MIPVGELEALAYTKQDRKPRVVLRSLLMTSCEYIDILSHAKDWESNQESSELIKAFADVEWAELVWVIEVSLPQIFPANESKLGEIVLNAQIPVDFCEETPGWSALQFARLPGAYFFKDVSRADDSAFIRLRSALISHIPVFAN